MAPLVQFFLVGTGYFLSLDEINQEIISVISAVLVFISIYILVFYLNKTKFYNYDLDYFNPKLKFYVILLLSFPFILYYLQKGILIDTESLNANRASGSKDETLFNFFIGIMLPNLYGIYLLAVNKIDTKRVLFFLLLSSFSLVTGFRSVLISNVLFLLLINFKVNKVFFIKYFKYYLLISLVLLATIGAFRDSGNLEFISFIQSSILRVSSFELITIMNDYVKINGFDSFYHNFVDSFNILIPRILYETKPLSLSEVVSTDVYSSYLNKIGIVRDVYGGVAYTIVGEAIWNAGFIGVALYGIIFGVFILKCEKYIHSSNWYKFLLGKSIFVNLLLLIESPQLGINAIILNYFVSLVIIFYYKVKI